jgi:hypothetical protein
MQALAKACSLGLFEKQRNSVDFDDTFPSIFCIVGSAVFGQPLQNKWIVYFVGAHLVRALMYDECSRGLHLWPP